MNGLGRSAARTSSSHSPASAAKRSGDVTSSYSRGEGPAMARPIMPAPYLYARRAVAAPRVLVAIDDHYGSLAAVRGLRRGGFDPWTAHPSRFVYGALSRAAVGHVRVRGAGQGRAGLVRAVERAR